jgi:mono/diheme cytochrome c family protein
VISLATSCGGQRPAAGDAQFHKGRALFSQSCSGCHTLTGDDTRTTGGDLAIADLSIGDIASFIRVMPVRLTTAQVDAVAVYVHAAEQARRGP